MAPGSFVGSDAEQAPTTGGSGKGMVPICSPYLFGNIAHGPKYRYRVPPSVIGRALARNVDMWEPYLLPFGSLIKPTGPY